jgi:hypothetical protein
MRKKVKDMRENNELSKASS